MLEETTLACKNLEENLLNKEKLYATKENELQENHRQEISKGLLL